MSERKSNHGKRHKSKGKGNKLVRIERQYTSAFQDNRIVKMRLIRTLGVSSNALGTIAQVFTMDPSNSTEWASASALYDEFRVVGSRVKIISTQQYSVTKATDMVVICYDNDDVTALTSVAQGYEFSNSHVFNAVFTHNCPMKEDQDCALVYSFLRPTSGHAIDWVDVSNPTNLLGSIKTYVTNLTVSTSYWVVAQEWFVEFRGRS